MIKYIQQYVTILMMCFFLGQCSSDYIFEEADLEFIDELTLTASSDMNRRTPLKVDFVIVKDPVIAEHFATLTARQYMKQRKQLKRDYPQSIKIKSFELIPDQSVVMPLKYLKKEVAAAFIFADYNNQRTNRWKVHAADIVKVKLLANRVDITSHKWNEKEIVPHARKHDGVVVLS
jgi:hypothetical protein